MITKVFFSNKKIAKQAAEELIERVDESLDFDPDLVLFYATLKYNGHYQDMLDIFKKRFGNVPQIGASIDGMIFPHDMRTDGAVLVLGKDKDARIEVKGANEKSAIRSAQKLAEMVKCEKGVVILHFPLVHVPGIKRSAEFYAAGKYYSARANRGDEGNKRKMARDFSDYCDKSKIFYLPPSILEIFAKEFEYKVPVVGVNVLHTRVKFNSPSIFSNYKDINDGIAALVIEKGDVEVVYDDIFPDKGATIEETMEIVNNNFQVIKKFNGLFEKNVLISLDGKAPMQAVKEVIGAYEKDEIELSANFNKGTFLAQVPYFLLFFNNETNGIVNIGIDAYFPFDFFPFFVDIDGFNNLVCLTQEPIFSQMYNFISGLFLLNNLDCFNFFCIDVGSVSAFGDKVANYQIEIEKKISDNYFGLLTSSPSVFIPEKHSGRRNYITELKKNIFYAGGGNNIFLSI